jgi:hypothetical protein
MLHIESSLAFYRAKESLIKVKTGFLDKGEEKWGREREREREMKEGRVEGRKAGRRKEGRKDGNKERNLFQGILFFEAFINGIIFLYSFSDCSLLIYRKAIDFCFCTPLLCRCLGDFWVI